MPVGFHTKQGNRRIRFTSNVSYEGVDYGPDYETAEVALPPNDAFRFVHEGRAVWADEGTTEPVIDESLTAPPAPKPKTGGRKN